MQARVLRSIAELRALGASWDDLWLASPLAIPTIKSEPLAIWLETFAAAEPIRIVVVEEQGNLLAALPLVSRRVYGLSAGFLPNNDWALSGDLLLDERVNAETVLALLADAVSELDCSLLWLNGIDLARRDWQLFQAALAERHCVARAHKIWDVGLVDIPHDWKRYLASRSRNHRRQLTRTGDRLRAAGGAQLNVVTWPAPYEIEALLRRGFDVETRSWKSIHGACVLRSPDIFEFYCRQAQVLAEEGNLTLVYLEHHGRPIAFEYGLHGKNVYFSPKVGYDEEFAQFSPGQQLRSLLFQQFSESSDISLVDFHGLLSDATGKWTTRTYESSRLAVGLNVRGKAAVCGDALARPLYKSLRKRLRGAAPEIEARPFAESESPTAAEPTQPEPLGAA